MPMTIYKLFGSVSQDSSATIDVQLDGEIQSILMTTDCSGADALNDGMRAELSFLSTNSFGTNDTRGSLMMIHNRMGILTQGGGNMDNNFSVSGLEVPVNAGERLHLHISHQGGATGTCHAYVYIRDKGVTRTPPRRR